MDRNRVGGARESAIRSRSDAGQAARDRRSGRYRVDSAPDPRSLTLTGRQENDIRVRQTVDRSCGPAGLKRQSATPEDRVAARISLEEKMQTAALRSVEDAIAAWRALAHAVA